MPRKKVVKSAARKKQPSKQTTKTPASSLQKIENDFSQAPAKLVDQLKKDIAALKQNEYKLATTLSKIQAQADKLVKTIASAQKIKTSAARKQLQAAKKALNNTKKDYSITNTALTKVVNELIDAEVSLARAEALAKLLKQFAKDWPQQAKKLKDKAKQAVAKAKAQAEAKAKAAAKAKAKPKAKAKRKVAPKAVETSAAPALSVIEQPQYNNFDQSADESTQFDDIKEAIS